MKLSRLFQSKASAFREAVATDDLPRMEKLMEKKGLGFLLEIMGGEFVAEITPRMTALLAKKLDDKVLQNWRLPTDSRDLVLNTMFVFALHYKRVDVAETLLEKGGKTFNVKSGAFYLSAVINADLPSDLRLDYLRKILSHGHDLMTDKDAAIKSAVEKGDLPALDLLAAAGFNVREQAGALLPVAVRARSTETALHLAAKYGADIDAAIAAGNAVGNAAETEFLEGVRARLPKAEKPRSVESLTAEVESLRETVRLLSERLGDKPLDKPVLKGPAR
ncbi:MAG TPA: hypothetical protein VEF76_14590 [Patescibacteria group bacterium]|nr:hypothetical protein [Patescibacteria group bacterium]